MIVGLYNKLKEILRNQDAALDISGQMYVQFRRTGTPSYYHALISRQMSGEVIADSQLKHAFFVDQEVNSIDEPAAIDQVEKTLVLERQRMLDTAMADKDALEDVAVSQSKNGAFSSTRAKPDCIHHLKNERLSFKHSLMSERSMSNKMAEKFLDLQGMERPQGWHSVFFYPDSMEPRGFWLLLFGAAAFVFWW